MKRETKRKTRSDKGTKVSFEEFTIGWTRQEAGWYTHTELGGIWRGRDGWIYSSTDSFLGGPYKTLLAAQRAAADLAAQKGKTK